MAYNGKHLAKLDDLKELGTKQKEVADALAARVDTLENVGSQANVLEGGQGERHCAVYRQ